MADVMKVRRTMSGAVGPNSNDNGYDEVGYEIETGDAIQECILVKMDNYLSDGSIDE
jgi:hypothetical protein